MRVRWQNRTKDVREAETRLEDELEKLEKERPRLVERYALEDGTREQDFRRLSAQIDGFRVGSPTTIATDLEPAQPPIPSVRCGDRDRKRARTIPKDFEPARLI